jgi:hypothetical protein
LNLRYARPLKFKTARTLVPLAVGLGLICFGAYSFWNRHQTTHGPVTVVAKNIITSSSATPAEGPVACSEYKTAPNQPRAVSLPSISATACLQELGIDQKHDAIAVPNNVNLAGWYIYSAVPGDEGVSIIDGHVSGRYAPGIFKNLAKVHMGDTVNIEFGDMSKRSFEVVSVDNYSVDQALSEQYKKLNGVDRQLTLITCGGNFDKSEQEYEERTIVRAKFIP